MQEHETYYEKTTRLLNYKISFNFNKLKTNTQNRFVELAFISEDTMAQIWKNQISPLILFKKKKPTPRKGLQGVGLLKHTMRKLM